MTGRDGERLTLKVDEAAGLLGIGREKTRLLCNSGVIPKARFLKWLDDPASQEALAVPPPTGPTPTLRTSRAP
jgi:hypothetical protein